MPRNLKPEFLLDPGVFYLNHGSFGACPRPVFERYQAYQRELELQPVDFISNRLFPLLSKARQVLAGYLGTVRENVVFVPNATFGVNVIARSLDLAAGDEILATDHEYGACDNAWSYLCRKSGARYIRRPVDLPVRTRAAFVDDFWAGVTEVTRVIYLSHITSPTAVILPVEEICRRARAAGILTVIDGAHAPGQIPLALDDLGADFYTGNCHKWMLSPKGAGFLYAHPRVQERVQPLVVSWGWSRQPGIAFESDFIDNQQWLGTDDLSAYLAVPTAIEFMADHDWPAVRAACHELLGEALAAVERLSGCEPVYTDDTFYAQMATTALPQLTDPQAFKRKMVETYQVEIPVTAWRDRHFLRISIQGYNTGEDVGRLIDALRMQSVLSPGG
ncbi:MAG TPA: aminotransferase class V-fold PLP-dependent enzyme [Anaerolineales bacterium]|nr:aminotransferase class V-fold PLP-dependent enzyme [Anaerolineales bacterium]